MQSILVKKCFKLILLNIENLIQCQTRAHRKYIYITLLCLTTVIKMEKKYACISKHLFKKWLLSVNEMTH